jgi:hypothetical protein
MATSDPVINLGIQVVWGISGTLNTSLLGVAYPIVEEDFQVTRQNEPHYEPETGAVWGETFYRREMTLRLRIYPAGTTSGGAAGALAANQHVFEPGDSVTLTDFNDNQLSGTWTLLDHAKQRRVADKVYFDVSLRRWAGYAPPAPMLATATAESPAPSTAKE